MEYGIAPLDGAGGVKAQGVLQHISTIKNDLQNTDDRNQWAKTDVNIAHLRDRTPPGEGRSQVDRWKKENDGREPDFVAIRSGMAHRKMDTMINTLSEKHGVTIKTDVAKLDEARFSIGADGKGTLQIPKTSAFRDLNHQMSSLFQAVAHAGLAREAQRLVAAAPEGHPNTAAEERVAAYSQPPSKQAKSPAFAEAELVASYTALHETTGLGLEYNPGPSVNDDKMQERWAAKLAEPGGYAEIERQITRTINLDQDLMPKRVPGRYQSREDVSGRDQAGRSNEEVAARAASELRRKGGGDDVPAPPERPTPASQAAGGTQTQKKGDAKPGDETKGGDKQGDGNPGGDGTRGGGTR